MGPKNTSRLAEFLDQNQSELLNEWIGEQLKSIRRDLIAESELKNQSRDFLRLLVHGVQTGSIDDIHGDSWADTRQFLMSLSEDRAKRGFTPTETALFIFSLKGPVTSRLRKAGGKETERALDDALTFNHLLDLLGLFTAESYQKVRESIINRQQQDMLELSTPVVSLWDGILALPIIGTLDSERSQTVMESLLNKIVETGSAIAIIDITGVPTVDTLTAQHLLKTVTAARLMGAECIISGIRPQIAQTIVHLGIDLNTVSTKASLRDAFASALDRAQLTVVKKTRVAGSPAGQS
ncbi:MAG: STAS domain-containing protein [Planctomycetia bacterium]|nr:STAS domain-containing protein [Planctomycetia bacterium]